MSEWKKYKLAELIKTNKKSISSAYTFDEIQYLDTGSITEGKIESFQNFKLSEAPSRAKRLVEKDDIVYSTVRPIQRHYGFITNPQENLVVSTGFATITANKKLLSPKYIYYFLSNNETVEYLDVIAEASTSTYPSLKPSDIENLEILLPPILKQTAIASVLSSLDDKIDLLQRQNETLEKMAETLFRQWFVEEAKEEWGEQPIFNIAIHFKDSIRPQKKPDDVFSHYSIPSFDNGKEPIIEFGKEIMSNKYLVPINSILFSKLNPHKDKRVWLILNELQPNSICSTEFQIVKPKNKDLLFFIYGWLTFKPNYDEISSGVGGTSGSHQRITPNSIFDFNCPKIETEYLQNYNELIKPIFKKQFSNQTQIRTITALRDTLLPKLMSGEVKVKMCK